MWVINKDTDWKSYRMSVHGELEGCIVHGEERERERANVQGMEDNIVTIERKGYRSDSDLKGAITHV